MKRKVLVIIMSAILTTGCSLTAEKTRAEYDEYEKITPQNYNTVECDMLFEAENCEANSDIYVENSSAGFSGTGYAKINSNGNFKLTVDIPASQHYTITAVHRSDDYKSNPLLIDGAKVLTMESGKEWQGTVAKNVFLKKGENIVTLGEGWSYFCLDSIRIQNGSALGDEIYDGMSESLSNKNANAKTQRIYNFFKDIYGKRTILGQCTAYGSHTEFDAFDKAFGKRPALRTFDFLYDSYTTCKGNPLAKDVTEAIEWSKEGGLVVFDWHWNDPINNSFSSENNSFLLADAVTDKDIACLSEKELDALCDSGEINNKTRLLLRDIDLISYLMSQMEKENITVIWRPLHEAEGGWFWWGASGAENYKWLWKLLHERMTNYWKLNNLIWLWNGQNPKWYPSDEYCDIVSIDIYNTPHDNSTAVNALADYQKITTSKPAAIAECSTMIDPKQIVRDNAYWLWFSC